MAAYVNQTGCNCHVTLHSTLDIQVLETRHSGLNTRHSVLDTKHSGLDTRHLSQTQDIRVLDTRRLRQTQDIQTLVTRHLGQTLDIHVVDTKQSDTSHQTLAIDTRQKTLDFCARHQTFGHQSLDIGELVTRHLRQTLDIRTIFGRSQTFTRQT